MMGTSCPEMEAIDRQVPGCPKCGMPFCCEAGGPHWQCGYHEGQVQPLGCRNRELEWQLSVVRRHMDERRRILTEQLKHARRMGHFNTGLELDSRLGELSLLDEALSKS